MKGLTLAEKYYYEIGRPMLEKHNFRNFFPVLPPDLWGTVPNVSDLTTIFLRIMISCRASASGWIPRLSKNRSSYARGLSTASQAVSRISCPQYNRLWFRPYRRNRNSRIFQSLHRCRAASAFPFSLADTSRRKACRSDCRKNF